MNPFASLPAEIVMVILGTLVALAVAAVLYGVRALWSMQQEPMARRIRAATAGASLMPTPSARPEAPSLLDPVLRSIGAVAKPTNEEELEGIRERLSHAGYRREQALITFTAVKVVLALVGAGVATYLNAVRPAAFDRAALYTIVAMMVGFYAPNVWLRGRIQERKVALTRGLPDALDLLVTCVEAGLGLDVAINRVASETRPSAPLLAAELMQTALELRAGLTRSESSRRLAKRTGVDELKYLSSVLVQTEMFGTSIAKSLRVMAEGMRVRRMQNAEKRAATVAVKMTIPLVVCILPSLFLIVLGPAMINIVQNMLPAIGGTR